MLAQLLAQLFAQLLAQMMLAHINCAIDYTADASENVTAILTVMAHLRVLNTLASTVQFIL